MANPNIASATNLYGNNAYVSLTTTSATQLISNPAGSGKIFKINLINVSNINATVAANITINLYSQAAMAGTAYPIGNALGVPAGVSLLVIDKSNSIYLLENQSIGVTAGAANYLIVIASWEEIS
jgi:hypothetical protein